jgi:DNA-directed RNA polymerase specialized sigma24 family protein
MRASRMSKAVEQRAESARLFPPTSWSAILPSGTAGGVDMAAVYDAYREPLVLYLLCLGHKPEDAADLLQGFFADLLRRDAPRGISPRKGRFRTFLITALKNYLSDQRDRLNAMKRGGGQTPLSVDELLARGGIDRALVDRKGPDWAYDKAWANAVLKAALSQLESEMARADKSPLFAALAPVLYQDTGTAPYREIAARLRTTEGAVKMAAKRVRDRLGVLIRQHVQATVADSRELEAELGYLIELLGES